MIILTRDIHELTAETSGQGQGFITEVKRDTKRGISAIMIVKEGTINKGDYIVSGNTLSTTRIMEDYNSKNIVSASVSDPIFVVGFDDVPSIGDKFYSYTNKKDAEKAIAIQYLEKSTQHIKEKNEKMQLPIIVKADVAGTLEAIVSEIKKLSKETIQYKIIYANVGLVGEKDIRSAEIEKGTMIINFKTAIEKSARDLNEVSKINIQTFDVIYKLTEFLSEDIEEKRPRQMIDEQIGKAKVLKTFGITKGKQVVGCKITDGKALLNARCKIARRENELGEGILTNLEKSKIKQKELEAGNECGMQIETKITIEIGDTIEFFVQKEI